jgi:glyoxylase-like metal-dependent hydrolase (beta-lactamase superfamily II)
MITTTKKLTEDRIIHQYWGTTSNIYIIECRTLETTYLVDCGMPSDVPKLKEVLDTKPPLTAVVCTHFHVDHISGWLKLKTLFNVCNIWFHDSAKPYVDGRKRIPFPGLNDYFNILRPCMQEYGYFPRLQELMSGALFGTPFKNGFPTDRLRYFSSDQMVLPGFKTIPTPGHRPDSVSFIDPDSGILITGDFLLVLNGKLTTNTFVASKTDQKKSYDLIKSTNGIQTIYPGHGRCVTFNL